MKTKQLTFSAMCIALIAICSWISIPFTIPFTLPTFGIFFTVRLLGGKYGSFSILAYILLGAVGLPVFSGFNCGFGALFGTTGGYITGFLPASLIAGWRSERRSRRLVDIIYMTIALIVCYAFGTFWYSLVYVGGISSIGAALAMCVVPYIIPDALKIALAALMAPRLRSFLNSRHIS